MSRNICQQNATKISNEGTSHDFLNKVNVKNGVINKEYDILMIGAV